MIFGAFAETQAVPPVQVFDKTMAVKQMHVLEPQDLLITRADKGTNPPFTSAFSSVFLQRTYLPFIPLWCSPPLLMLLSTYLTFPTLLSQ